jgi:hypothetical protein
MSKIETVRLSLEVPADLAHRAKDQMPYGIRAAVLRALLEAVLDAEEEHGKMIFGAIIDREFQLVYHPKELSHAKKP